VNLKNKKKVIVAAKKIDRPTLYLIFATFFNPFGFDAAFKMVMDLTGSYWITDAIFYCLSAFFFGLYFLFFREKPKKS
jgi:hypothetical protein